MASGTEHLFLGYDGEARELWRRSFTVPNPAGVGFEARPFRVSDVDGVAAALIRRDGDASSFLALIDLSTLEIRVVSSPQRDILAMAPDPVDGGFVLFSTNVFHVSAAGEIHSGMGLGLICGADTKYVDGHFLPRGGLVLSARRTVQALAYVEDRVSQQCERMTSYEAKGAPFGLVVLPDGRAVAAFDRAVSDPQAASSLALVQLDERRILPGAVEVGKGSITDLAVDDRGDVWALLASEGKLVRARLGAS